ncbi:hypothetical protein V6N11_067033 [Hibiscus sabdariffa]|uniref:Ionotropic glutamate receptor C-terminal domain-containing protein n=1 Tax=Hibiscus sabdariffa TaxID=183260 RepID=A0ABR2SPP7_9ROSI
MAVEKAGTANLSFNKPNISSRSVLTGLETLGVSGNGPRLIQELSNITFEGLSGDFHFVNGQLEASVFEIVNINGNGERRVGFWTPQSGLVRDLYSTDTSANSNSKPKLGPIIWPGDTNMVPKVEQLQPTVTDLNELLKRRESVGLYNGSFVEGILLGLKFDKSQLKYYGSLEELHELFVKGNANGGITTVESRFKTDGFGFVFPKGSPLVADISRGILNVTQGDEMERIQNKWFKGDGTCPDVDPVVSSNTLGLESFWGLFLIAGVASISALLVFTAMFLYEQRHVLLQFPPETSMRMKVGILLRILDQKDLSCHTFKNVESREASSHYSVDSISVEGSSSSTNCSQSPSISQNPTDSPDITPSSVEAC